MMLEGSLLLGMNFRTRLPRTAFLHALPLQKKKKGLVWTYVSGENVNSTVC